MDEAEKQKSGRSEENQEKQLWKLRRENARKLWKPRKENDLSKAREVRSKMW